MECICWKTPVVQERYVLSCPVFSVENGAILVGLGVFIVALTILPVIIGIPSVCHWSFRY